MKITHSLCNSLIGTMGKGRYPPIVFLVYCYLNMGYDSKMIMYFWSEFGHEIFNEHDLMFITKVTLKNR